MDIFTIQKPDSYIEAGVETGEEPAREQALVPGPLFAECYNI